LAPEVPPNELWELITVRAAAIALEAQSNEVGSLQPGKLADAVVFPGHPATIRCAKFWSPLFEPTEVWLDGQRI
jgi:imidazolonepropionase-like amidohydrolase